LGNVTGEGGATALYAESKMGAQVTDRGFLLSLVIFLSTGESTF